MEVNFFMAKQDFLPAEILHALLIIGKAMWKPVYILALPIDPNSDLITL